SAPVRNTWTNCWPYSKRSAKRWLTVAAGQSAEARDDWSKSVLPLGDFPFLLTFRLLFALGHGNRGNTVDLLEKTAVHPQGPQRAPLCGRWGDNRLDAAMELDL